MADLNTEKKEQDIIQDGSYLHDSYFYDLDPRKEIWVDIPYCVEQAKKTDGKILELAVGNGRITIPMAKEANNEIWALEYSQHMIDVFKANMKKLPPQVNNRIHLFQGDMSNFDVEEKEFSLILLPANSFQLLLKKEQQRSCLKSIANHLAEDGRFILILANYTSKADSIWSNIETWESQEEVLDWEVTDPKTGYTVRRSHINKRMHRGYRVIYPEKRYKVTDNGKMVKEIVKTLPLKYYTEQTIKRMLHQNGFDIEQEMGYYDGRPIEEGNRFIFICRKKAAANRS